MAWNCVSASMIVQQVRVDQARRQPVIDGQAVLNYAHNAMVEAIDASTLNLLLA